MWEGSCGETESGRESGENLSKKYSTVVNNSGPYLTKVCGEQIIRIDGGFIGLGIVQSIENG